MTPWTALALVTFILTSIISPFSRAADPLSKAAGNPRPPGRIGRLSIHPKGELLSGILPFPLILLTSSNTAATFGGVSVLLAGSSCGKHFGFACAPGMLQCAMLLFLLALACKGLGGYADAGSGYSKLLTDTLGGLLAATALLSSET